MTTRERKTQTPKTPAKAMPTHGGSYRRDPDTGELVPLDQDGNPLPAAKPEEKT